MNIEGRTFFQSFSFGHFFDLCHPGK